MTTTKTSLFIASLALLLVTSGVLHAASEHDHSGHQHNNEHHTESIDHNTRHDNYGMKKEMMFLVQQQIDGYDVSFHVMKAKPGKEMGGSHDFMIKVEKMAE